jgi:hypothetical protein
VALPIAGGRHHAAAPSCSRHSSQLGGLEGPRRSPTQIQDDASTHSSAHGVFGKYLIKIQRELTSICHHCQEEEDTAQHTLERCPAWEEPRRVLCLTIGDRLAPEAVIKAMTRGQQELAAVRNYCEQVMLAKERAVKNREKRGDPVRVSRRREPIRRHATAAPPLPPS